MPDPKSYGNQVPLGLLTVTAQGTTVVLSQNCGPFGGSIYTGRGQHGRAGRAGQQCTIVAAPTNTANLIRMPAGKTFAANPGLACSRIAPGGSETFPAGIGGPGVLPENWCLDSDGAGTQTAVGYITMS